MRVVAVLWGEVKTGKTSFALTFPPPIWLYDFNFGTEGLNSGLMARVEKHFQYGLPPFADLDEKRDILARFRSEYRRGARECKAGGTIVIDTATELHDIILDVMAEEVRVHKYGGKKDAEDFILQPVDYNMRNDKMHSVMVGVLSRPDLNGAMTHHAKDVYDGKDRVPGKIELSGWKYMPADGQVAVQTMRKGMEFFGKISSSRVNPKIEGWSMPELTYDYLYTIIYGSPPQAGSGQAPSTGSGQAPPA